jgi:hypothetical protein
MAAIEGSPVSHRFLHGDLPGPVARLPRPDVVPTGDLIFVHHGSGGNGLDHGARPPPNRKGRHSNPTALQPSHSLGFANPNGQGNQALHPCSRRIRIRFPTGVTTARPGTAHGAAQDIELQQPVATPRSGSWTLAGSRGASGYLQRDSVRIRSRHFWNPFRDGSHELVEGVDGMPRRASCAPFSGWYR